MNYLMMLKQTMGHMTHNGSWIAGVTVALPAWILRKHDILPSAYHDWLVVALLLVIMLDWLCGSALARRSTTVTKSSSTAIDSLIRDCMIMICVGLAYLMDYALQTGSFIFVVFVMAFIWQNFISVMANVYVLGWERYFPMWLVNIINNEITHKIKKYLEDSHEKDK